MPLAPSDAGGMVALARLGQRTLAYVADADSRALHVVDVDARALVSTTPLSGVPAALLVARDGSVVVAIRDRSTLDVFDVSSEPSAPLERRCTVAVATEPVALAATAHGETLLVVSRWGHALGGYSMDRMERQFTVDLARDPSAVVTSADDRTAFIAHAVGGRMSEVDLAAPAHAKEIPLGARRKVDGNARMVFANAPHPQTFEQSFAIVRRPEGGVLVPGVLADPVPIIDGMAANYGGRWWNTDPSMSFAIGSLAGKDASPLLATSPALGFADCLLPRAAAMDEKAGQMLVACLGRDEIIAYDVKGTLSSARSRRVWKVGAGPMGIALDEDAERAVVWSQYDGELDVIALGPEKEAPRRIGIPAHVALDSTLDLGRRLFHAANGSRIAFDGRACASCHLDGRDDGLTWFTRTGPRQTPMLLGRLGVTAPYGWTGADKTLRAHFVASLDRLGGTGLSSSETDAVFAWIQSLPAPTTPTSASEQNARGAVLFHSEETTCAVCHAGEDTTDRGAHDVGTGSRYEAALFDTPSLRFVGRSAPYLHDGRFPTIRALLEGMDGRMGSIQHLSPEDKDALVGYVESL